MTDLGRLSARYLLLLVNARNRWKNRFLQLLSETDEGVCVRAFLALSGVAYQFKPVEAEGPKNAFACLSSASTPTEFSCPPRPHPTDVLYRPESPG